MLFSLTADYTPQAVAKMRDNPTINRREILEQTLEAAGGKVLAFYGRIVNGPGALAIIDADPTTAMAFVGMATASGGIHNVRMERLLSQEEIVALRQKAGELAKTYRSAAG